MHQYLELNSILPAPSHLHYSLVSCWCILVPHTLVIPVQCLGRGEEIIEKNKAYPTPQHFFSGYATEWTAIKKLELTVFTYCIIICG